MFAHSATSNSGAINFALLLSASASGVPASSTTHLTAMLASITSVLTALPVPPEGEFLMAFASGVLSASADQLPALRKRAQFRQQGPDEEFPDARPQSSG